MTMRGYGETQYEHEDGWSPVADAVAVLDAAGVGEAIVVASSMGGQTVIDLALGHPDRVAGLVLIGPAIRGAPYPELVDGPTAELNSKIEAAEAAGDVDQVNRLEARMMLPDAQLVWLDDVAHLPQLESDPTTLEEIAKFVEAQRAGYRNSPTGMSHQ